MSFKQDDETAEYIGRVRLSIRSHCSKESLDIKTLLFFPISLTIDPEELTRPTESVHDKETGTEYVPLYDEDEILGVMAYWRHKFLQKEMPVDICGLKYDFLRTSQEKDHLITDGEGHLYIDCQRLSEKYLSKKTVRIKEEPL